VTRDQTEREAISQTPETLAEALAHDFDQLPVLHDHRAVDSDTASGDATPCEPLLSVVVPMFNESATVADIVQQILTVEVPARIELIAVDDASDDNSAEIVGGFEDERVTVIRRTENGGKGAAIRDGLALTTGDYVVIQDADLEYDPSDWARMLAVLENDEVLAVYGSRFLGSSMDRGRWQNRAANWALSRFTSVLFGHTLTDMETCYKMIDREVFLGLELSANRFDIEPEITAKLLRGGHRIVEVPISYTPRTHTEGKKIGWRDGVQAGSSLLKWWFVLSR